MTARRRTRAVPLAALAALAILLTGCGSPGSAAPAPPARHDPLALVGRWHVEADGEAPGTALVLGEGLAVFAACGVLDGGWRADAEQGLFVASSHSGDGSCSTGARRHPLAWLEGATAFRVDGDARRLLAPDGRTLAVLRPGAAPTVGPGRSSSYAEPPRTSPALRERADVPAPLPEGLRAPGPADLQRAWAPPGRAPERAELSFGASGAWAGSDGCNGIGGRYVLGEGGRLLSTTGPQTLVGCDNAPLSGWLSQAERVGLAGEQLVLLARGGAEIGRLVPRG